MLWRGSVVVLRVSLSLDLLSTHTTAQEKDERKRQELAGALGITEDEAAKLQTGVGTSSMSSMSEEEEDIF